jgi:tetratricopeptide (TPR) repeat protein
MRIRLILLTALLLGFLAVPQQAAHADIAPPKTPPGSNLLPGKESTLVRMLAETVTLTISADPADAAAASARTHAVFTMRNLGASEEAMQARFPLSFFDGSSDGRFEFPEIPSISVKVDGRSVATHRQMQPPIEGSSSYRERDEVPWAVFDVAFPPSQDVTVEVNYTAQSYGYFPQATFEYVLETGAGWNGTIGSADIIVQLPYDARAENVMVHDSALSDVSTAGSVLAQNEIRWHFEDLEPTQESNIEVILIAPGLWESILKETHAVTVNPAEGEAWGRLAKAYKQAARLPKGWLRDDPAGRAMLESSDAAYQKCLALLPRDALWHYGYADLLWSEYYFDVRASSRPDSQGILPRALKELQTTLALDPDNAQAKDLLLEISTAVDGAVQVSGDQYVFLALTATPPPPTPYPDLSTETPAAPTQTAALQSPGAVPTRTAESKPTARNPLCGGTALLVGLPVVGFFSRRLRRQA